MAALDTYHVREFVVAEVRDVARLLLPGIPDDRVGKVVLLHAHLPTGNDIRDDMLRLRVLVDSVGPFTHRDDVAAFLEDLVVPSLRMNEAQLTGLRAFVIIASTCTSDLTEHRTHRYRPTL